MALNTIAIDAGKELAESAAPGQPESQPSGGQASQDSRFPQTRACWPTLPEGPYPSSMIVILSDGENNMSLDPFEAAQAAADRDVRIDTIGFGSTAGIALEINGFSVHTALNEAVLQQIAQVAGGQYYHAQNEQDPQVIYENITPQAGGQTRNYRDHFHPGRGQYGWFDARWGFFALLVWPPAVKASPAEGLEGLYEFTLA